MYEPGEVYKHGGRGNTAGYEMKCDVSEKCAKERDRFDRR